MDLKNYITGFSSNKDVFRVLFMDMTADQWNWRPAPEKWNLLEILCHLYDEEREDFRARLRSILDAPEKPFEPIDPAGWVTSRSYSTKDRREVFDGFLREREISIEWLKTLEYANWENTHQHPRIGPMSAKFILANWLAHDYLHIRQIIRVKYEFLQQTSGENLAYAGAW